MLWRLFLLGVLIVAPLYLLSGCGGGVSGPNPMTQAGLGTVVVKVDYSDASIVVSLDNIVRPARGGRAIFYDITPGRHRITVSSSSSIFSSSLTVDAIADKTVTISVSPTEAAATPTPFVTPFGN